MFFRRFQIIEQMIPSGMDMKNNKIAEAKELSFSEGLESEEDFAFSTPPCLKIFQDVQKWQGSFSHFIQSVNDGYRRNFPCHFFEKGKDSPKKQQNTDAINGIAQREIISKQPSQRRFSSFTYLIDTCVGQTSEEKLQKDCIDCLMDKDATYEELANKILSLLKQQDTRFIDFFDQLPESILEFSETKKTNKKIYLADVCKKLDILQREGVTWSFLKKEHAQNMAEAVEGAISWEEMRNILNFSVRYLTGLACEAMDMPKVAWKALGTRSWKSDVDNTQFVVDGCDAPSPGQAVFIRNLADLFFLALSRGVSGSKCDTEHYFLLYPMLRTLSYVYSQEGQSTLMAYELSMAAMQRSFGCGEDREKFQNWAKLESHYLPVCPGIREAFLDACRDINDFHEALNFEISKEAVVEELVHQEKKSFFEAREQLEEQCSHADVKKRAAEIFAVKPELLGQVSAKVINRILQKCALRCDEMEHQKWDLENDFLETKKKNKLCLDKGIFHCREVSETKKKALENLVIDIHWLYQFMNCLLPEGVFTSSEMNVTLLKKEGQQFQKAHDFARLRSSSLIRKLSQIASTEIDDENIDGCLTPNTRKKFFEPKKKFSTASKQELFIASMEELAQLEHLLDQLDFEESQKEMHKLIAAAKYAYRVIERTKRMLLEVQKEHTNGQMSKEFEKILTSVQEFEDKAYALEICKRSVKLAPCAASREITQVIAHYFKDREDKGDPIFSKLQSFQGLLKIKIRQENEAEQAKEECYSHLLEWITDWIECEFCIPEKPECEIRQQVKVILKAASAFYTYQRHDKVEYFIKKGVKLTLFELGLESCFALRHFYSDLKKLNRQARQLLLETGDIHWPSSKHLSTQERSYYETLQWALL